MIKCSFCGRSANTVRCIQRPDKSDTAICAICIKRFRAGEGYIAHCEGCKPENGQHAPTCTEWQIA